MHCAANNQSIAESFEWFISSLGHKRLLDEVCVEIKEILAQWGSLAGTYVLRTGASSVEILLRFTEPLTSHLTMNISIPKFSIILFQSLQFPLAFNRQHIISNFHRDLDSNFPKPSASGTPALCQLTRLQFNIAESPTHGGAFCSCVPQCKQSHAMCVSCKRCQVSRRQR